MIANRDIPAIFEGAFEHDEAFVRVDILHRRRDGRWRLIEVKLSASMKESIVKTWPFNIALSSNCGLDVASYHLAIGKTIEAAMIARELLDRGDAQGLCVICPPHLLRPMAGRNDLAQDVFGTREDIPRNQMVCRAVNKVHNQIRTSSMPNLPLIWSEFNASYKNEPDVTDAVYIGPWLADTIRQCDGLVDSMSYWTFADVFKEQGVVKTPFYLGYGLVAVDDIPKLAFNAFKLLHKLGKKRIEIDSDSALLTRRENGTLVLAVWNDAPPEQPSSPRTITLRLKGTHAKQALNFAIGQRAWRFSRRLREDGYPTLSQSGANLEIAAGCGTSSAGTHPNEKW